MTGGLKVYYFPYTAFHDVVTFPTGFSAFPLLRKIFIREQIDVVHGHQATSNLAFESIFHARTMGLHVMYTDHSLFNFEDVGAIHVNKLLKVFLAVIDHAICVSHTDRENLVLRASLLPNLVSVIPNALDASLFTPDVRKRPPLSSITVVVLSRLTQRKGVDLLAAMLPEACARFPDVNFIVGGDGPKRLCLEEMREKHRLQDRITMLGAIPHADVPEVLSRGHIFLNTSLTEAFCIAIVEAAAAGLLVVSTNVGGIPEVLPPTMIKLASPSVPDLLEALAKAIEEVHLVDPHAFHEEVSRMYSWKDVAKRTAKIYRRVLKVTPYSLLERLERIHASGPICGKIFVFLWMFDHLLWRFLEWIQPRSTIDIAVNFPERATEGGI